MKPIFYEWLRTCITPRRHMGFAYYSARRNQVLWVIYPFHYVLAVLWWIQLRWAEHTGNPSWIERELEARLQESLNNRRFP